jgi:chromosomal replication initiator protein
MGRPDPQIRDAMLAHLRHNYPSMCRHWFDNIEAVDLSGGTLRLLVRENVQLEFLRKRCIEQFKEAAQVASGRLLAVKFVGEDELGEDGRPIQNGQERGRSSLSQRDGAVATSLASQVLEEEMLLSPDYAFEHFVIGPGNRLAHAAAIAVAQKVGKAYNPFFIHGGVGLGKTHLLQAICQAALRSNPKMRLHYVSCDQFRNQFHDSVQAGVMHDFRHRFRNVDLLVVDDIHDLSKHDRTQEEFFHTFNSLYQAGKQIVLSSDAAPGEIPELEERLISRFNCGLVARIEKPCYETRVAIVKKKAELRNVLLPEDVASYIAARIDSNIRELEGAITKIQGLALVENLPIDLELAKTAIGENTAASGAPSPSIQTILDAITEFYDVRLTDLLSKRRHKSIARPRQIGMWLARKHTRYSLEEIGSYFGGRDHTTVMHAIRTIDERREVDTGLNREVSSIEEKISGGVAEIGLES